MNATCELQRTLKSFKAFRRPFFITAHNRQCVFLVGQLAPELALVANMASYIYISRRPTIQEQFACYLARHPDIYAEFKRVCTTLYERGIRRYSAFAVVGVVRYHHALQTGTEDVHVDNNLVPMLARKLMDEDSRFAGFFETRKLQRAI